MMTINTATTPSLAAWRCADAVARAAAWAVSRIRPLVHHRLNDDECEGAGLPVGSAEPAVHVLRIVGMPWWRFDSWVERDSTAEHCLHLDLLGFTVEVYFLSGGNEASEAPARP